MVISIFCGGMVGRIGNIVWSCGADQHADPYHNSLRTGHARFGHCWLLTPEHADTFCEWMGVKRSLIDQR